jgi:hypothetical protein
VCGRDDGGNTDAVVGGRPASTLSADTGTFCCNAWETAAARVPRAASPPAPHKGPHDGRYSVTCTLKRSVYTVCVRVCVLGARWARDGVGGLASTVTVWLLQETVTPQQVAYKPMHV